MFTDESPQYKMVFTLWYNIIFFCMLSTFTLWDSGGSSDWPAGSISVSTPLQVTGNAGQTWTHARFYFLSTDPALHTLFTSNPGSPESFVSEWKHPESSERCDVSSLCRDVSRVCLTWQDEEDDDEDLRRWTAARRDGVHPVRLRVCVCSLSS